MDSTAEPKGREAPGGGHDLDAEVRALSAERDLSGARAGVIKAYAGAQKSLGLGWAAGA